MPWTSPAQSQTQPETALTEAYQFWNAGNAAQAELLCRQVLAAWPGQADALHLLGLIAHAYGNCDLAIDYLREACRAPRAPASFFRNLAEMCRRQGLLSEGERNGRLAVKLDPNDSDAWNNLGILLQESGKVIESIECLNRALALRPKAPHLLNNLGNSCRLVGRHEDAERYYNRALQQAPDYAEAHNNLAALTAMRGDYDAAVAHARTALECEPQFAAAYLNLADIETARGNLGEALRWLDMLQAFATDHIGALNARATLLLRTGQADAAIETAQRAVSLAPQNGTAHLRLADVLRMQGRLEEASIEYNKAAALPGLHIEEAMLCQMSLLQQAGHPSEAHAILAEARRLFPGSARVLIAQIGNKNLPADEADLVKLETLIATPGKLDTELQVNARFVLGQALLNRGETSRALVHLEQGNRLKRTAFTHDTEHLANWMEEIAAAFPNKLQATLNAPTLPVFIIGMPCSGTDLVEQLLCTHPHVASVGEQSTLAQAVEQAGNYPQEVANWNEATWRTIGQNYLTAGQLPDGANHLLLDAMPGNFVYAGVIAHALPGARIIHCRRDPLETCMSCYCTLFAGAQQPFCYDLRELGLFFRAYHRLMIHWRSVLPSGCLIEVDYDALCAHPQTERQRLINLLGLPENASNLCLPPISPLPDKPSSRWRDHSEQLSPLLTLLGDEHP